MFQKVYNILKEFLGESKQGGYIRDTYQYQFNCPCCREENGGVPDNKYNLEVNFAIGKFQCWRCGETDGTRGNISYLIKRYGSPSLFRAYKDEIAELNRIRMYDINAFSGMTFNTADIPQLTLPESYHKIDINICNDKILLAYLAKRKIDQGIIDKFNIGYTTRYDKDWTVKNRIIIPSYNRYGELNFWVGRDFMPPRVGTYKAKVIVDGKETEIEKKIPQPPKYKNCNADKKNIIFQDELIDYDADICLVEGAIDCIYGPNTISMLGKVLTKDTALFKSLYQKSNGKIIICLDSDTDINETKKIYKLLNYGRLKDKIWYIRMDKYKDFGEVYEAEGKKGIINTLKSAKQFSEFELNF